MPITSYEDALAAAEDAAARAAALRRNVDQPQGKMVGKFYVQPHWTDRLAPILNQVYAGFESGRAQGYNKQARELMEGEANEWMQRRPQATQQTVELSGPQEEGVEGPLTGQQTVAPTQQQNLEWAQQGATNPLTKALAAEYGKDILVKEPEREEARAWRSHESALTRADAMERHVQTLQQRAHEAEMRSQDTRLGIDQRAQASQEANSIRMQIAEMTNALGRANLDLQHHLGHLRDDTNRYGIDERSKANRLKMGAKAVSELDEADSIVKGIDVALTQLGEVKDSPAGAWVRGAITSAGSGGERIASGMRDRVDNQARETAFNISSGIQHGRYGAALSRVEAAQAAQYLPSQYDDAKRIGEKLTSLKALMDLNHKRLRLMESSGITLEEAMRTYPPMTAPRATAAPASAAGAAGGNTGQGVGGVSGIGDLTPAEQAELARRRAAGGGR